MQAEEIMRFALFKEVPKRSQRKKRKLNTGAAKRRADGAGADSDEDSDGDGDGSDEEDEPTRMTSPPAAPKGTAKAPPPAQEEDMGMAVDDDAAGATGDAPDPRLTRYDDSSILGLSG